MPPEELGGRPSAVSKTWRAAPGLARRRGESPLATARWSARQRMMPASASMPSSGAAPNMGPVREVANDRSSRSRGTVAKRPYCSFRKTSPKAATVRSLVQARRSMTLPRENSG